MHLARAIVIYSGSVFAAGFLLAVLRVTLLLPRMGVRVAGSIYLFMLLLFALMPVLVGMRK